MTEREEGYRAGREARMGFVERAARGSHTSADTVTRMVNAAVYRYEHARQGEAQDVEKAEET